MTVSHSRALYALLALIVAMMATITTPAYADNTKDASFYVECTATYHGDTQSADVYALDKTLSASERTSIETMLIERSLIPYFAAVYHKEYYDYPNPPKSVTRADLSNVRCKWTNL